MASSKKSDETDAPSYPEGTHPAPAPSETTFAAENKKYADMPDKPDPTTVAQVEIVEE